jgi:hypothetical protein
MRIQFEDWNRGGPLFDLPEEMIDSLADLAENPIRPWMDGAGLDAGDHPIAPWSTRPWGFSFALQRVHSAFLPLTQPQPHRPHQTSHHGTAGVTEQQMLRWAQAYASFIDQRSSSDVRAPGWW